MNRKLIVRAWAPVIVVWMTLNVAWALVIGLATNDDAVGLVLGLLGGVALGLSLPWWGIDRYERAKTKAFRREIIEQRAAAQADYERLLATEFTVSEYQREMAANPEALRAELDRREP